jgi:mannosyl-3-phosphoglycerate phosphatase family protein
MIVIFTDLDGTLLDRDSYAWDAALPAVRLLRDRGVAWVFVTSKTRAEVEYWRRVMANDHPFVVENGGAIFVPCGYFGGIAGTTRQNGYELIERGEPYDKLIAVLERASRESRCRVRGFHDMTAEEVAAACHLPIEQAVLAKQREYDEPFEIIDLERAGDLRTAIAAEGMMSVVGGRFQHVSGVHDKGCAVKLLTSQFRRCAGNHVTTIGLGDGLNDIPLLLAVDVPVVVRSADAAEVLERVPTALVATHRGPEGWRDAVLEIVSDLSGKQDESS